MGISEVAEIFGCSKMAVYRWAGNRLPEIRALGAKRGMLASEVWAALKNLPSRHEVARRKVGHLEKLARSRREAAARRKERSRPSE
jgi:hypothetical protein